MYFGTPTKPPKGARINYAHPSARGLVFCVLFNEGAGDPYDAVEYGAASISRQGTTIWRGQGLYQDGNANNYVNYGNPRKLQFTEASSFSIHSIVTVDGGSGGYRDILRHDPGGVGRTLALFRVTDSSRLQVQLGNTGTGLGSITGNASITPIPSKPRHLSFVRNVETDTLLLYVDGVLDTSTTDSSGGTWTLNVTNWQSRFEQPASDAWNGTQISHFIYNRALSGYEIQRLAADPYGFIYRRSVALLHVPPPIVPTVDTWYQPSNLPVIERIEVVGY